MDELKILLIECLRGVTYTQAAAIEMAREFGKTICPWYRQTGAHEFTTTFGLECDHGRDCIICTDRIGIRWFWMVEDVYGYIRQYCPWCRLSIYLGSYVTLMAMDVGINFQRRN